MPETSIVITTYNHLDENLKPCLESIIRNTDLDNIEIIIVDYSCTNNIQSYIEKLGTPFNLTQVDEAVGRVKATNIGIAQCKSEYIILLNDNIQILDYWGKNQWVSTLIQPLQKNPKIGIVGIRTQYSIVTNTIYLPIFCIATRKNIFNEIGLLDEIFSPQYNHDIDFCIRLQDAGYEIFSLEGHDDSGNYPLYNSSDSLIHDSFDLNIIKDQLDYILASKYINRIDTSGLPGGWFSENDISVYKDLVGNVPQNGHIAEIGCFQGRSLCSIAQLIKNKNLNVIAIDLFTYNSSSYTDVVWAKYFTIKEKCQANLLKFGIADNTTLIQSDSIKASTQYPDNYFDLIFIDADHSYDAVKNDIIHWSPKLKQGGIIAGHDFRNSAGVNKAIQKLFPNGLCNDNIWIKFKESIVSP
jgi:hypothetical protein